MNSIGFEYKGKQMQYSAPSKWNEVSVKQLMQWVILMYKNLDE